MGILKLPVVLTVLFIALNHLEGGGKPTERQEWIVSALPRNMLLELKGAEHEARKPKSVTSHQMEKRKCGTATCATQHLANFLTPSSNKLGAIFSPTKMGSNTYVKRKKAEILKREPLSYLPI